MTNPRCTAGRQVAERVRAPSMHLLAMGCIFASLLVLYRFLDDRAP